MTLFRPWESARTPAIGEAKKAAREVEEVIIDFARLDNSTDGSGERDGERCRSVEEMIPVSSILLSENECSREGVWGTCSQTVTHSTRQRQ